VGKSVLSVPESTKAGHGFQGAVTAVNGSALLCWLTVLAAQKMRCCFGHKFLGAGLCT
jgi:hypothetical protein